jgi:hypothetical protein
MSGRKRPDTFGLWHPPPETVNSLI